LTAKTGDNIGDVKLDGDRGWALDASAAVGARWGVHIALAADGLAGARARVPQEATPTMR
jgi:hypothetical protein